MATPMMSRRSGREPFRAREVVSGAISGVVCVW